jgi:glycyl-tRNA synthetase beta chain
MKGSADLLVEIGTEELPPKSLRELELAFAGGVAAGLREAALGGDAVRSFASPRRLAVLVSNVRTEQPAQRIEKRGPPLAVAFDAAGNPSRAAQAFAQGCGVGVDALEKLETKQGAWLMYRGEVPGRPAADVLAGIVAKALEELPIARRMRWGARETEFVRPVHWVVMLHGTEVVPADVLGLTAGRVTRGHRVLSKGELSLPNAGAYAEILEASGFVVADFLKRRERIRTLANEAAQREQLTLVMESEVLDEVTSLVEWPVAITATFDREYLRLPPEVLAATLQGHQRYFPLRTKDGALAPKFIAIANLESRNPEQIRLGNERVVKPRLADAAFFWDQDGRQTLAARCEALKNVVFQRGLGTLFDKSARVKRIGVALAPALGASPAAVSRAAEISKADLLTSMVKEFPELQGCIGMHYAARDGEARDVAVAIAEQYLPRQAGDEIAATPAGRCLALADRFDTLAGVFALGKRPTGNKDPFGLRRAALAIVRTLIESGTELSLPSAIAEAIAAQTCAVADRGALNEELYGFLIDRLRPYYLDGLAPGFPAGTVTAELFESVRARAPASALDFHERLTAVCAFMALDAAQSLAVANKRIANILKGAAAEALTEIDSKLFVDEAERRLDAVVSALVPAHRGDLAGRRYAQALSRLASLRAPVDQFFEAVMVMAPEPELRRNRLALLHRLRELFLDVADLSAIPGT